MKKIINILKKAGDAFMMVLVGVGLIGFVVGAIDEIYLFCTGSSFTFIPTLKFIAWVLGAPG
ncbi:MAG: hypothetical protein ABIC96_01675 [Patescibacteria group bacterium]